MQLKLELHESTAELRRLRQRLVHVDHDAQGKVQWMLAWERQVGGRTHGTELPQGEAGPGGLGWPAWKGFLDRSLSESQKTQRLIGRAVTGAEVARATCEDIRGEAARAADALQKAEEQLSEEEAATARLSRAAAARCPRDGGHSRERGRGRQRSLAAALQQEFAAREHTEAQTRRGEEGALRRERLLETELEAARQKLQTEAAQQRRRKVQRATAERDDVAATLRAALGEFECREEEQDAVVRDELGTLESELSQAEVSVPEAEGEVRQEERLVEELRSAVLRSERQEEEARQHTVEAARAAKAEAASLRLRAPAARPQGGAPAEPGESAAPSPA